MLVLKTKKNKDNDTGTEEVPWEQSFQLYFVSLNSPVVTFFVLVSYIHSGWVFWEYFFFLCKEKLPCNIICSHFTPSPTPKYFLPAYQHKSMHTLLFFFPSFFLFSFFHLFLPSFFLSHHFSRSFSLILPISKRHIYYNKTKTDK